MRYPASEKLEIIRLVERSHLPVLRTLDKLGIPATTFYRWYDRYLRGGVQALEDRSPKPKRVWNRIPDDIRERIVDMALQEPELSPRELAVQFTDTQSYFVSEASVYRLLKALDLITSPAFVVIKAANEFRDKTTAPNQMWQTDFTYLKVIGVSSNPYLKASSDGQVLLSWTESAEGTRRGRNAFMASLNSHGNTGEIRRINDQDGEVHWSGGDNRLKFTIGEDGNVAALWQVALPEFKTTDVRFASASKDGAFQPSARLNDDPNVDPPVAHAFSHVAAAPNGNIYATWIDGRNRTYLGMGEPVSAAERRKHIKMRDLTIPDSIMKMGPQVRREFAENSSQLFMAVSEDGGKTFGKNYPISDIRVCGCCAPNIAFLDGGETIVVSYRQVADDYLRDNVVIRSSDAGKTFSKPEYISDDGWVAKFCPYAGPSMTSDQAGDLHVLWFTAGKKDLVDEGIYYTSSTDGGQSFAPRELVTKTPAHTILHTQIVADASGRLWGVWENIEEGERKPRIYMVHRAPGDTEWSDVVQVSDENSATSMLPTIATDGQTIYIAWNEKEGENSLVKLRTLSIVGS